MSRKQTSSISPQIAKAIHKQSKDSDSSSSEKRYGKFWKPNEDSLLMELHIRHNGNWKLIAEGIPGRNLSQCQQRWKRINPNKVFLHLFLTKLRKQWTDFEDQEVLRLVNEHGRNWKLIEGLMEGRSSKQIRERFLNNLDPEINRENSLYRKIKSFQNNIEYTVLSGARSQRCQIEDQYSEDLSLGKLSEESILLLYKKSTYVR